MDRKLLILSLIFIAIFSLFMGALLLENPARIKATSSRIPAKCLLFVKPVLQSVPSDGKSAATLTVSVTDADFNIVPGKTVTIQVDLGQLDKEELQTGDSGIAQFKLTSTTAGTARIKAKVADLVCEPTGGITIEFI